ncbi:MAG: anti-sigma factor domain-containing protein [Spirochaetales bacterium]|jgi:hypothetical protein|nr:anti-sigma factor domain-containing protein [Spirochaetales bacterium]
MKGVIWKIEGRKSIVLFQNGDFRAIPTPPEAQTGMALTVSYNKKRLFVFAGILCSLVITVVFAALMYFLPAGYIDIIYGREDRRIIVELMVNRFDHILETRIFSSQPAFSASLPPLKYEELDEGYANTLKAASLLPMAPDVRVQITHKDIRRAEKIKARLEYLTKAVEEMTGRKLSLAFEIEQYK